MGLGNGKLGAAFWAKDGLTVQLNRADTLPYRRSSGQVSFPDLQRLTSDRSFRGRVNLYDGALEENGGGVSLRTWVDHSADRVIVDVRGLPPSSLQHIRLHLWEPRNPIASTQGDMAVLAETWLDDKLPGASNRRFGSVAAIEVANGRDSTANVIDSRTVEVTARPTIDGALRVIIAAPAFDEHRASADVVHDALGVPIDASSTTVWWHTFWSHALLIRAESRDGTARYAETMRMLYLFASAAHNGDSIPGSQAGIADLFSSAKDDHFWDPAAFWFWNLRMQVGANLASGVPQLNAPVFALYRNNLDAIHRWTLEHMGGRPGICVPETMRFNGKGVEYESDGLRPFPITTHSCDLSWSASSNARTLSSGAEIGLWVWRTYLQTRDLAFLDANYPLMAESARFLLSYQKNGKDGQLHTSPSNAHETQMDVTDPTTDLAAIHALYPATIAAAQLLQRDADLSAQLKTALQKTPPLPLVGASIVASPSADALPADKVIAASYEPTVPYSNGENIGLEPVWPYDLIGIDSPLFKLAQRTYALRPFVHAADWSLDPIQAARLGLGTEVADAIFQLVQLYQVFPNGMSALVPGTPDEFYIEQSGVVALAMSEVLAIQDNDGLIRVGPAIPPGWTIAGSAALQGGAIVDVQAVDGHLTAFRLHGEEGSTLHFLTPWEGRKLQIFDNGKPDKIIDGGRFTLAAAAGHDYRFELVGSHVKPAFHGELSATVKILGRASIGLGPPCCAPPAGYDGSSDQ
jgi:alpha-L-fucosidase 2